jgi:hypothetical protein
MIYRMVNKGFLMPETRLHDVVTSGGQLMLFVGEVHTELRLYTNNVITNNKCIQVWCLPPTYNFASLHDIIRTINVSSG